MAAPNPITYTTGITVPELNALIVILRDKVQRPVFDPDPAVREQTAAVESFIDRSIRTVNAAQRAEREAETARTEQAHEALMTQLVEAQAEIAGLRGECPPLGQPLGEDGTP